MGVGTYNRDVLGFVQMINSSKKENHKAMTETVDIRYFYHYLFYP